MKRFFTDFKMGFKLLMLCLFIGGSVQSWGQLNYPNQGFETTADDDDWDQGGFFVRTSNSVCGSTKMMQDNLYSSIPQATLYNETTMGTTNGGIVTVSFDFSYTNYSGPSTFTVDAKWCSSKNAGCTVIASYTQADFAVGTCVTKTPTYSAPASANNFLAFEVKRLTGDFYPNFEIIEEEYCQG